MNKEETTIQVSRDGKEISISALIPAWFTKNPSGDFKISLPLLGFETNCDSESEIEDAVKEAVKGFCIVSDKHGKGIEKEFELLGWKVKSTKKKKVFTMPKIKAPVFNNLFQTGHPQLMSFVL